MNTRSMLVVALSLAGVLTCGAAQAQQSYPNKAVRFIVTYPPGGSSDVMARIIGKQLTEYWGQQVLVDTRPGADGAIGMEYASKQPADGYTFLLGNFGPVVAKPLLAKVLVRLAAGFRAGIAHHDVGQHPGGADDPAGEEREAARRARQGASRAS